MRAAGGVVVHRQRAGYVSSCGGRETDVDVAGLATGRLLSDRAKQPSPLEPRTKPAEGVATLLKWTVVLPIFFTAIEVWALVLLMISGANSRLAGWNCSVGAAATPLPVRLAVMVLVVLSAKVTGKLTVPDRAPVAEGVNVKYI